jgi:hypothetical protein
MKTIINNDFRIKIINKLQENSFCNIEDLRNFKDMNQGYFKIYHFWNNKAQKRF